MEERSDLVFIILLVGASTGACVAMIVRSCLMRGPPDIFNKVFAKVLRFLGCSCCVARNSPSGDTSPVLRNRIDSSMPNLDLKRASSRLRNSIGMLNDLDRRLSTSSMVLQEEHMVQHIVVQSEEDSLHLDNQVTDDLSKENVESSETHSTIDIEEQPSDCLRCSDGVGKINDSPSQYTHIRIPHSKNERDGSNKDGSAGDSNMREAPIQCAICLTDYTISDPVCWASKCSGCTHVFHRKCIRPWLLNVMLKASPDDTPQTPTKLACPMCRQDFV